MPELPEVETICTGLRPVIVNQRISRIGVTQEQLRWPVPVSRLKSLAEGQKITAVQRRAKYIIWTMQNGAYIIIHLGMSGRLVCFTPDMPVENHTHIIFQLQDSCQIRYRDPRRFGFIDAISTHEFDDYFRFRLLGVEPLSTEFNPEYLHGNSTRSKRAIKNVLMDARVVAGIGNIYANEALFRAGILPNRPGESISKKECKSIVNGTKIVLEKAIARGGTTVNDFQNSQGDAGFFQLDLAVYGRSGEPCKSCGCTIERIVMTGRSSFYCPGCQQ